jgi:flagellar biosynthesis/type III secretory pathway chaperone
MMTEENKLRFKLKTNELVAIWQKFCESHTELYDLTCEEYMYLLESDIDSLEGALESKSTLLENITALDTERQSLLTELGTLSNKELTSLSQLTQELQDNELLADAKQLTSLNALLLDIINKIQDQNKKNQLFLNKAILSLKDLKESFSGKKNYKTYGSNGITKANITP